MVISNLKDDHIYPLVTLYALKIAHVEPADIKNIPIPGKFKQALRRWQDGVRADLQRGHNTRR
jgi:hypothetical protein